MIGHTLDILYTDERAERSVYEPTGMTQDEILQWYMEQPRPFRRRHIARIRQLSELLMIQAIIGAVDEVFPHTYAKKAVLQ